MDLATSYMGPQLKNPLVASASPLNADLDNIRRLEDYCATAIVLPSIFEEQIEAEAERFETLASVQAESFPEALTFFPQYSVDEVGPRRYLDVVRRAVEAVDIPIIASLNGTTSEGWISYARRIQEAGASGLEHNVYFIPTDLFLTSQAVEQRYLDIVRAVRAAVSIPVAVKLSPYFSAFGNMAAELDRAGADALVLFNRFYQPDIDLVQLRLLNDLRLSGPNEIGLSLRDDQPNAGVSDWLRPLGVAEPLGHPDYGAGCCGRNAEAAVWRPPACRTRFPIGALRFSYAARHRGVSSLALDVLARPGRLPGRPAACPGGSPRAYGSPPL
jgi:dihydroorotate dehydrogenase